MVNKKSTKLEEAVLEPPVEETKEDDISTSQENGEVKKLPVKKAKTKITEKKSSTEPSRKSSRAPKPIAKENGQPTETANMGKKRSASRSPVKSSKKSKPEEDYEVQDIVGMRIKKGKKEFKIRWKGFKPSDDSWEPVKNLSCQDLIKEYEEKHKEEVMTGGKPKKKTPAKKTPAKSKKSKKTKAK